LQDHVDVGAQREQRLVEVADTAGVEHPTPRPVTPAA
jgi:hypothetical protein